MRTQSLTPKSEPAAAPHQPGLRQRQSVRRAAWNGLMYTILGTIGLMYLFPILWALTASVKKLDEIYTVPPSVWVSHPQWSNYPVALSKLPFVAFMLNSLVISVSAVVGQVFAASLVGFAFARLRWRGRDFWFLVLLATMMLPGQVLLIPQYLIFKELGWVNTYKPLIVPAWLGGGAFFIFLFRQFFRAIPREMEEAARLDGASSWQVYWHLFLPNARPILATVTVLAFIGHWKDFMGPLIYLSDFNRYPISLGLYMYSAIEGSWTNYLMAASVVALSPLVILFIVAQRYFRQGMLLTGSKG
jgi:ABC-type glycerol-3-phosphate transport system permease component